MIQNFQANLGQLLAQSIGVGIAIAIALVVLLITNSVAKWVRRLVALAVGRTLKSPSLRSLFVQTSYV
ncbi:MAG: hypothetical protein ACRDEA_02035, partial [Microcystaceae cyanobacterium]